MVRGLERDVYNVLDGFSGMPLTFRDLREFFPDTGVTLTLALRNLEGNGYIVSAPDPDSARGRVYRVTEIFDEA